MKSTDERLNEVLERARQRKAKTRRRRQGMLAVGGGAVSIAVIVVASMYAASFGIIDAPVLDSPHQLMASVFSGGAALGYIAVGLLGLMLGVAVTVLAFRVGRKRLAEEPQKPQEAEAPENDGADRGEGTP